MEQHDAWKGSAMGLGLAVLCAVMPVMGAAEDFVLTDHLSLSASNRMRGEFTSWFDPVGPNSNNTYNFFANRARLGVTLEFPMVEFFVEAQDTRMVNLPGSDAINTQRIDPPAAPRPGVGPLGPGAVYFANTHKRDQGETILHHGYATVRNFGLPGVSARMGRMGYNHGLEKVSADPTIAWLQKNRISQRLIGNFDYTHVGRGFDGVMPIFNHGDLNLTTLISHPTSGGFEVSANKGISDIDLISSTASMVGDGKFGPYSAQFFYVYYRDRRDLVVTDNRPLAPPVGTCADVTDPGAYRSCDNGDIAVSTIGVNLAQAFRLGPGTADLMFWGAGQFGDWESQDHQAWAYTGEGGYQLGDVPLRPWLRVGYFYSTGDDDPTDDRHRSFFQLLPTARLYALFPFYNMMNNQDMFVQAITRPTESLSIELSGHWLRATESQDLLYAGGGATSDTFFGYSGFPAGGRNEVAYLADVSASYTINKHLAVYGYYGHAFGQGVVSANFKSSGADYGFIETTVSF